MYTAIPPLATNGKAFSLYITNILRTLIHMVGVRMGVLLNGICVN